MKAQGDVRTAAGSSPVRFLLVILEPTQSSRNAEDRNAQHAHHHPCRSTRQRPEGDNAIDHIQVRHLLFASSNPPSDDAASRPRLASTATQLTRNNDDWDLAHSVALHE